MKYPVFFPQNCPPRRAVEGPKKLYRLVTSVVLQPADFLTTFEEGKHDDAEVCRRCSISTFDDISEAARLRRVVRFFRKHLIAEGVVPKEAGRLMHTPSKYCGGHWSWWPADEISRHGYFLVVPEPSSNNAAQ